MFLISLKKVPSLYSGVLDVEDIGQPNASHVVLVVGFVKVMIIGAVAQFLPFVMAFVRAGELG
jgi:hypothetical protein